MTQYGTKTPRNQRVFRGDVLRRFRKAKGYSQARLAVMVELSRTQIVNLENGVSEPSLKTLALIAYVLEIDANILLDLAPLITTAMGTDPLPFDDESTV